MPRHLFERCPQCGQPLSGDSYRTLAQENQDLRREVERLRPELRDWNRGGFVSRDWAKHFHRPDCHWARYIKPKCRIDYLSQEEAVQVGKKPCKTCCS
ncbi:MAG: hypothetical protein KatS3mg109_1776 [Pirellulaceae bacterium]|nr:MAG: hypothetical protein KatS3mg109_1776 [Pirellulaceae bacterium]